MIFFQINTKLFDEGIVNLPNITSIFRILPPNLRNFIFRKAWLEYSNKISLNQNLREIKKRKNISVYKTHLF